MLQKELPPPKTNRKFGTIWGELDYLCKKIHYWLYARKERSAARRYLSRLQKVLDKLPQNDLAVLREEGFALLHELQGDKRLAIKHRQREIQLMKELHLSVQKSITAGDYDAKTAESILAGRDASVLEERKAILQTLEEEP